MTAVPAPFDLTETEYRNYLAMTENSEDAVFDSDKAAQRISRMWLGLGDKIVSALDHIEAGADIALAVRWACCAEACFWKATGEADAHDVKDVLAFSAVVSEDRADG